MSREVVTEAVTQVQDWLRGCSRLELVEHAIVLGVALHIVRSAHKVLCCVSVTLVYPDCGVRECGNRVLLDCARVQPNDQTCISF